MDKGLIKASKTACTIGMTLWTLWAIVFILRLLRFANIISFNCGLGIDIAPIVWIDDPEVVPVQWVELLGYIISNVLMLTLTFIFLYKSLNGVSTNSIFNSTNAGLLNALVCVSFFYELFDDNRLIIFGERALVLTSDIFVVPLCILVISIFYKLALNAYEENHLTI